MNAWTLPKDQPNTLSPKSKRDACTWPSAHADYREILDWLGRIDKPPRRTFVTHGEPAASDALRARIKQELNWECRVPEHLETVALNGAAS